MSEGIFDRYPAARGNALATARLCGVARDKGLLDDALALGLAAIGQAPQDMHVRDVVRAALSANIPAFHAPMLHDHPRNRAYARAIARAVRPDMLVLEIGTGAGLLALMAARAGAIVVTCEANPMIAAAAREIVARNGMAERITVVAKPSDALEIGIDLPAPADMLIHEIFGDTLFGEGVVASVTDARSRLLKPDALVVPPRAELRFALVEAGSRAAALASVEGFDLSPFGLLRRPITRYIGAGARDIAIRSQPLSALSVDFASPCPFGSDRETVTLGSSGGKIDAVVQWLRIDFGDGEVFENNPFNDGPSHWKAPLFELPEPIETSAGTPIEVTFRRNGASVTLNACPA